MLFPRFEPEPITQSRRSLSPGVRNIAVKPQQELRLFKPDDTNERAEKSMRPSVGRIFLVSLFRSRGKSSCPEAHPRSNPQPETRPGPYHYLPHRVQCTTTHLIGAASTGLAVILRGIAAVVVATVLGILRSSSSRSSGSSWLGVRPRLRCFSLSVHRFAGLLDKAKTNTRATRQQRQRCLSC